jgi:peptidoglycan hydrolase-like protein with peptidoglycan-binding domain
VNPLNAARRVPVLIAATAVVLVLAGVAGAMTFRDEPLEQTARTEGRAADRTTTTTRPPSTTASSAPSTTSTEPTTTTAPPTTAPSTTTTAPATTTTAPPVLNSADQPGPEGNLGSGAKGQRVRALQESLKAQGYDPGTADGELGLKTVQAIYAWQALHGMAKDGVLSPASYDRVLAREGFAMKYPNLGPNHTEVDLTRQTMVVWRGGAVVLATHVSTGSQKAYCEEGNCGDAVTPTGAYKYTRRIPGWREAPLGKLYNPVYFNGGIAVHGAGSVPTYPASHGCVRIPMHIAEYFPTLVNNGDAIQVFRS